MVGNLLRGIGAGAVGTLALNATTYLDMLVRGRAPSDLPERAAGQLAERLGIDLGRDGDHGAAGNRRTALGALLGYATGTVVGAGYGVVRARAGSLSLPVAAAGATLAAMAASNVPATLSGLTDPREWGWQGWLADIVPHLAFGLATALTYDALAAGSRSGR